MIVFKRFAPAAESSGPDASGSNNVDYRASLDLLYALDAGLYRFFAEFIATDDNSELARLHLGYQIRSGTTFWMSMRQMIHCMAIRKADSFTATIAVIATCLCISFVLCNLATDTDARSLYEDLKILLEIPCGPD